MRIAVGGQSSVKTAEALGVCGYYAGKKIKGLRYHILISFIYSLRTVVA